MLVLLDGSKEPSISLDLGSSLELMELILKIALVFVSGLLCFQFSYCDNQLNGSGSQTWTCLCDAAPAGYPNYTPASNCSTSCGCTPVTRGLPQETWNCSCESKSTPQTPAYIHGATCFTTCNCSYDSLGTAEGTKKHISSKTILVVLLLCFAATVIAILSLVACCFYHKERHYQQSSLSSSEKDLSWNSTTDLISHRSASFTQGQHKNFPFKPISGIIQKVSLVFRRERGTLPGTILQFFYVELEQATDNFSIANRVGVGGSSNVYRGRLRDGKLVAVKKLRPLGESETENEFLSEIELLSRLNHCHVVPLLGYCMENQGKQLERLLVFEYVSNGNLRDCLDTRLGKEPMDWDTRVRIALGAARGLEYLHEAAAPRILHRDVKSTNILLDEKFRAKITDLGMAKRLMSDELSSCPSSPARMLGTFGYFAPEYAIVGKASLKSDVFSFGVVILELITGRQPIHKSNKGDESLVIWATSRLRDSKLVVSELPDPLLKGNFPQEEMQIMAHLARECLQWDPDSRPTMSEIVQILLTISPDKPKRKILPTTYLMSPYIHNVKRSSGAQTSEIPAERRDSSREASGRWSIQQSLPNTDVRDLCADSEKNAETCLSAEYMERLMFLTSNNRSWRATDDEIVDLMEPRFESFVQANVNSG